MIKYYPYANVQNGIEFIKSTIRYEYTYIHIPLQYQWFGDADASRAAATVYTEEGTTGATNR